MDKLTPKQKAFADNYIISGNATEAAIKAGYSEKSARQMGAENLTKPYILEYIKQRTAPTEQKRIASGDEVLQFFTRVMNGEEKDAFGLDVSVSDRMAAGREILKRNVDTAKLDNERERLKLEKICGARTVYAIKQYQKAREADKPGSVGAIDGIAGPKTLQDMIAL